MKNKLKSPINQLRVIAILEGISYLLFAITMPLKYYAEMPEPNMVVGMAHGVLFILFNLLALRVTIGHSWTFKRLILCFLASLIPFGTFVLDRKILLPESLKNG